MTEAGVQLGERFVPQSVILERAARAASGLKHAGVGREDRVAIMLRNDIPYIEASLAARVVGALPVPINWHLKPDEFGYILKDSGAKVLVIHADLLRELHGAVPAGVKVIEVRVPEILCECYGVEDAGQTGLLGAEDWDTWLARHAPWTNAPDFETASMIYTSGTTGRPKGVRRNSATPEQYAQSVSVVGRILGVLPGIRTVIPAPMYHSAPNTFTIYAVQLGAFVVIMPKFDAEDLLRVIDKYKVTHFQAVPTMFVRLLKLPEAIRRKYDVSSLQYVIHAAAPCPPEVKKAMIEWWGPIIWEYYGSTEMSAVTHCSSEDALRYPGTVGKAVPEATVKILDEQGRECPAGTPGHVYGRLHVTTDFTYQNDPEKRSRIEREGLITSGDIGYLNAEGLLFLCDRANDMIISGGVNIYPAEIESVLINFPGVHDCAVFGIPHPDFGESVMAVVEPQPGVKLNEDELRAYLRERVADYKVPRTIEFRSGLPREDSGKLFKRRLREPYWQAAGRKI
jgi:long-chain acyl-CoA synthetase